MDNHRTTALCALLFGFLWCQAIARAEEPIKMDYSSVDASNAVWYVAQDVSGRTIRY